MFDWVQDAVKYKGQDCPVEGKHYDKNSRWYVWMVPQKLNEGQQRQHLLTAVIRTKTMMVIPVCQLIEPNRIALPAQVPGLVIGFRFICS